MSLSLVLLLSFSSLLRHNYRIGVHLFDPETVSVAICNCRITVHYILRIRTAPGDTVGSTRPLTASTVKRKPALSHPPHTTLLPSIVWPHSSGSLEIIDPAGAGPSHPGQCVSGTLGSSARSQHCSAQLFRCAVG